MKFACFQFPRQAFGPLVSGNSFHRHLGGVSVSDVRELLVRGPGLEREKPKGNEV